LHGAGKEVVAHVPKCRGMPPLVFDEEGSPK